MCFTFLEICKYCVVLKPVLSLTWPSVPHHRMALRYTVFGLTTVIGLLGLALTFAWMFQCTPFLSNFLYSVNATSCVNYDIFRWSMYEETSILLYKLTYIVWIGLSIPIDLLILAVPLRILHQTRMPERERRILRLVFSANLLGTMTWYAISILQFRSSNLVSVYWGYTACTRIESLNPTSLSTTRQRLS